MERTLSQRYVVAALSINVAASSLRFAQSRGPTIAADALAIYALLIPSMWATSGSKDVLLLQRETVKPYACRPTARPNDPEWDAAEKQYEEGTNASTINVNSAIGSVRMYMKYAGVAL